MKTAAEYYADWYKVCFDHSDYMEFAAAYAAYVTSRSEVKNKEPYTDFD